MKTLFLLLLSGFIVAASAESDVSKAVLQIYGWTNIRQLDSVPRALQVPLISVGYIYQDTPHMTPQGERIGKITSDEVTIQDDIRDVIVAVYSGETNSETEHVEYIAIFTANQLLIFNKVGGDTRQQLRCRYKMRCISLLDKDFKFEAWIR